MNELDAYRDKLQRVEAKWLESCRKVDQLEVTLSLVNNGARCLTHGADSMYACARCYADEGNRLNELKAAIASLYMLADRMSRRP
jgi:hypothetical protein